MPQEQNKSPNILWWLTSLAISVVCCAVLFILFAGNLVELRAAIKDDAARIAQLEQRLDRATTDIAVLNKHEGMTSAADAANAVPSTGDASPATVAPAADAAAPVSPMGAPAETSAPASPEPATSSATVPVIQPPQLGAPIVPSAPVMSPSVPMMPANAPVPAHPTPAP